MALDLAIDLQTGDLTFSAHMDLGLVTSSSLILQRIHTRLKIEQGSFIYNKSLGSKLNSALDMMERAGKTALPAMIRDALSPMQDIAVINIQVRSRDDGEDVGEGILVAYITYSEILSSGPQVQPTISTLAVNIPGSSLPL